MKVNISFKIVNSEYNKAYAAEYHGGEESDGNYKYHSGATYRLENVNEVKTRSGDLSFNFELTNGEKINYIFPEMEVFECIKGENIKKYAASKKILKTTHTSTRGQVKYIAFYISDQFDIIEVAPFIYIDKADFPPPLAEKIKELMEKEKNQ